MGAGQAADCRGCAREESGLARDSVDSVEEDLDSGYEDACYIANEYRKERMFEDELCDPMIEELFAAVKEDQSYHMVLTEVRKGLPKEAVKLLTPDHPAWVMVQQ